MIVFSGSYIVSLRVAPSDEPPALLLAIGRKGEPPDGEVRLRLSAAKLLIAALQRDVANLEAPAPPTDPRARDVQPVHRPGVPFGRKRVAP